MSAPLSPERLPEIAARTAEATAGEWLVADGDDGRPLVYVESSPGAHVLASGLAREADAQWICKARAWVPTLLAEVERLRTEVEGLHRSVDEQMETIQEAAIAIAERGDELQNLRAELAARPTRAEVLREEAAGIVASCPEHGDGDTCWPDCHCPVAEDMLRRADDHLEGAEPGTPTPLRWGLDDAELGDDDSVTLLLSGPDREPYVLELEPERAAALREVLADTGGCECDPMQLAPGKYMHHSACPTRQGETGGAR